MLTYSVAGDLRFISHHDTLRLFQRAFARADVPVRYTEGFNPRPRIIIPVPRPVGVASDDEALIVETDGPIDPERILQALSEQTPAELRVLGVRRLQAGERPQPARVRYRIEPAEPPIPDLASRITRLLETEVVPVQRVHVTKGTRQTVNIRPYIADLLLDDQAVLMTLIVTGSGTAKPSEVAAALGYDPGAVNHRVRRLEIQWH
jgi:radical SAM-linked protein